jgi:8-oxo-dGTP diphosphatase
MPATMVSIAGNVTMYCQRCGQNTEMREIEGRQRPVCVACGAVTYLDPKLAVAVVIERDGQVLLGLRAEGSREAGKWGIPAGFVDRGEVVETAAVREIAEEVGLHVTLGPVLGVYSEPDEPVVLIVYPALSATGHAVANDDISEIGWFSPDDLPPLAFPRDIEILSTWERWRATRAVV